jgi:hypothetical protein
LDSLWVGYEEIVSLNSCQHFPNNIGRNKDMRNVCS